MTMIMITIMTIKVFLLSYSSNSRLMTFIGSIDIISLLPLRMLYHVYLVML